MMSENAAHLRLGRRRDLVYLSRFRTFFFPGVWKWWDRERAEEREREPEETNRASNDRTNEPSLKPQKGDTQNWGVASAFLVFIFSFFFSFLEKDNNPSCTFLIGKNHFLKTK